MNENQAPQLFNSPGGDLTASGDAAAVARATQEIQAALVIAKRFPRDDVASEARILSACKRRGLAEVAEYEYSRGGTRITGPTIDLLRAIANRWGNLLYGWSEVERSNGQSSVRCWAWDTQSNSRAERTFVVRHWRDTQAGGYALEDERDIYELLANMASRRVRACLEEVIDADIVDKAIDQCRRTLKEGAKEPLKDRASRMLVEFADHGVTQSMIERRLGNKLDAISENQLASLRRVFVALRDGVGKREDYFKPDTAGPDFPGEPREPADSGPFPPQEAPEAPPPSRRTPRAPKPPQSQPVAAAATYSGPSEAPEPAPTPAHAATPAPGGEGTRFNYLQALRGLLKTTKIREGGLLDWLSKVGSTSGDVATLEELQLQYPETVRMCVEQWHDIHRRMLPGE